MAQGTHGEVDIIAVQIYMELKPISCLWCSYAVKSEVEPLAYEEGGVMVAYSMRYRPLWWSL